MKKIQLYRMALLAMLPTLVLTSCRFTDEDYFDESPALRIEHQGDAVRELLTSAPNGWVMQFFCASEEATFEGFNLFARFEANDKVTFASNHRFLRNGNAGKYTEASSIYEILNEDGLVLAFNVWNDVLTPFSDPVSFGYAPNNIVKNGIGMYGDHNFVVMSYNDNEIIMRGERHQAEVRLKKLDCSWTDYIAKTDSMKDVITKTAINDYYVTNGDQTLYFSGLRKGSFLFTDNLDKTKSVKVDSIACCFTPTGFRLERQNTIGQDKFHEFTISDDTSCLISEDGKVKVIPCWDNYVIHGPSNWRINPASFTAQQLSIYQQMEAEVKKVNKDYVLDSILIGHSTELQADNTTKVYPGLFLYVHGPKKMGRTPQYKPYIDMAINKPAFGQIQFGKIEGSRISSSMEIFTSSDLQSLCEQFAETMYGTYTIVPNHYFRPTNAVLNPVNGGDAIKLMLQNIAE